MYRSRTKIDINTLFFVALTLYLVGRCYEYTIWSSNLIVFTSVLKNISYIIVIPCITIALIKISKKKIKKYIPLILILFFYLAYLVIFNINAGFVCFGFSVAAISIKREKLFKYLQWVFVILLLSVIILGLFSNNVTTRTFGDTRNRYSFGFTDPYSMQMLWMSVVTCSIIIRKKKNGLYLLLMILPTVIFHLLGDVRAAFLSTMLLLLLDFALEKKIIKIIKKNKKSHKNFIISNIFTICFLLINALCWMNYKNPSYITIGLDALFTGRISMTTRFIKYVCGGKIPVFPIQGVDFDLDAVAALSSLTLDSSYASMLFIGGIIYSLITLIVLYKFTSIITKEGDIRMIAILFSEAINGILQPTVMSVLYNPIILIAAYYVIGNFADNSRALVSDIDRRMRYAK